MGHAEEQTINSDGALIVVALANNRQVFAVDNGALASRFGVVHLYSVAALTDAAGNVVERYSYDAYGKQTVTSPTGAVRVKSSVGNRTGFTGREIDPETGLMYFRARYYSTGLGRFTRRDDYSKQWSGNVITTSMGMGYQDGFSLYRAYFAGNSLDPTGHETLEECLIACVNGYWGRRGQIHKKFAPEFDRISEEIDAREKEYEETRKKTVNELGSGGSKGIDKVGEAVGLGGAVGAGVETARGPKGNPIKGGHAAVAGALVALTKAANYAEEAGKIMRRQQSEIYEARGVLNKIWNEWDLANAKNDRAYSCCVQKCYEKHGQAGH